MGVVMGVVFGAVVCKVVRSKGRRGERAWQRLANGGEYRHAGTYTAAASARRVSPLALARE